jgi:hypothetical protein
MPRNSGVGVGQNFPLGPNVFLKIEELPYFYFFFYHTTFQTKEIQTKTIH